MCHQLERQERWQIPGSFLKRTVYKEIHKSVCFEQTLIHTSPRERHKVLLAETIQLNPIIIYTSPLCVLGLYPLSLTDGKKGGLGSSL